MLPYIFYFYYQPYIFNCVYMCPLLNNTKKYEEKQSQFRKSKKSKGKKDKIYIPEVIDLVTCFNPAILNSKEFNCVARLNARKIVKKMLKSLLSDSAHENKEIKKYLLWYYSYFYNYKQN